MAVSALVSTPSSTATTLPTRRTRFPQEHPLNNPLLFHSRLSRGQFGYVCRRSCSRRSCSYGAVSSSATSMSVMQQDPYSTLGLSSNASEDEIKKARRKLALKFHPDVCKADSCAAKFIQVEQAYETIMDCLHGKKSSIGNVEYKDAHEGMMGVYDDSWEDWEEWMGWEGAGTRDFSSHINHAL